MPVSKSRIFSFDGLQKGDYLVEYGILAHHYLVESVSSTECTVIESWRKRIQRRTLNANVFCTSAWFYKLNYAPGTCKCVLETKDYDTLLDNFHLKRKYARKRLIHYLKTNRDDEINLTDLSDSCLLSDALEQPSGKPLSVVPIDTLSYSNLSEGDHIIYIGSSPGYTPVYRSGLVIETDIPQNKVKICLLYTSDAADE